MTQTAHRHQEQHQRRRSVRRLERPRRGAEHVPAPAPTETWGDMKERHRREHHEAHLRTAAALNDLEQAIRRAERRCDALADRLDQEERRLAKVRATLVR